MSLDILSWVKNPETSTLTIRQLGILIVLKTDSKNNRTIAEELGLSEPVVCHNLDSLFDKDLIKKEERLNYRNKVNRKVNFVALTEKAKALFENETV